MKRYIKSSSPEDFAGGYTEWNLLSSKPVKEDSGFTVTLNMWYNEFNDMYVFTEGDPVIYYPENTEEYYWECEDEDEAYEWWNSL